MRNFSLAYSMPVPPRQLGESWRGREGEEGEGEAQREWRLMWQKGVLGRGEQQTPFEEWGENWRMSVWWRWFELRGWGGDGLEEDETRRIAENEVRTAAWANGYDGGWEGEGDDGGWGGEDSESSWDGGPSRDVEGDEARRIAEDEARIAAWAIGDNGDDGGWEWEGEEDDGGWEGEGSESSWDSGPSRDVEGDEARRIADDEARIAAWAVGDDGDDGGWEEEGYEGDEEDGGGEERRRITEDEKALRIWAWSNGVEPGG